MSTEKNDNSVIPRSEMLKRYEKAVKFEHLYIGGYTDLNAAVTPNWLACGTRFWYRKKDAKAVSFILADIKKAEKKRAFDHDRLAGELSEATGEKCDPADLPIAIESMSETDIVFSAFERDWKFTFSGKLTEEKIDRKPAHPSIWRLSPDEKTALYKKDYNLWSRDIESGAERPLTSDGVKHYSYASAPEGRNLTGELYDLPWDDEFVQVAFTCAAEVLWSPDGKKIFTYQLDEQQVKTLPTISFVPQDGDLRPRVVEPKFPLPGDKHVPTYRFVILDAETGEETAVDHLPIEDSFLWGCPVSGNRCWWSGDSSKAYFLNMTRGHKSVSVVEVDVSTGACRILFEDRSDTFLEIGPHFEKPTPIKPLADTNELIWFSYRSGYPHLYLYDLETGKLKNPITKGDWAVHDIVLFDEKARDVFVEIMGRHDDRDFYRRELARVNIDTGEMTLIASGDFDVQSATPNFSADRNYVVLTYSRVDTPQKTELRDRSGNVVMELEEADLTRLPEGWEWPEPFETLAEDGVTKLYGTLFKPSDFDPQKHYPVLDFSRWNNMGFMSHPRHSLAPYSFSEIAQSMAELGLIVMIMEGRGGGYREKSIRDYGYDDFWEIGATRDHVAAMKALAETRPYMDLDRVGAMDFDVSGPICALMDFPDFYKVGIAHSLYDPRFAKQGEVYSGITDEQKRRDYKVWDDRIHNLKGKLLIITGFMDQWFHPSMTFQLTDLLLKANKDFDQYIHPNGAHMGRCAFARRRAYDYLTRHLIGGEPPSEFVHFSSAQLATPQWVWPEKGLTE